MLRTYGVDCMHGAAGIFAKHDAIRSLDNA